MAQLGLTVSIPATKVLDAPAHGATTVDESATATFYVMKLQKHCDHREPPTADADHGASSYNGGGRIGGGGASPGAYDGGTPDEGSPATTDELPEVVEYEVKIRYSQVEALHRKHFVNHPIAKQVAFPPKWTLADVCWGRAAKVEFRRRTFEVYFRRLLR